MLLAPLVAFAGVLGIKGNFESPKVAFEKKKPNLFEALKAKEELEESEVSELGQIL